MSFPFRLLFSFRFDCFIRWLTTFWQRKKIPISKVLAPLLIVWDDTLPWRLPLKISPPLFETLRPEINRKWTFWWLGERDYNFKLSHGHRFRWRSPSVTSHVHYNRFFLLLHRSDFGLSIAVMLEAINNFRCCNWYASLLDFTAFDWLPDGPRAS